MNLFRGSGTLPHYQEGGVRRRRPPPCIRPWLLSVVQCTCEGLHLHTHTNDDDLRILFFWVTLSLYILTHHAPAFDDCVTVSAVLCRVQCKPAGFHICCSVQIQRCTYKPFVKVITQTQAWILLSNRKAKNRKMLIPNVGYKTS